MAEMPMVGVRVPQNSQKHIEAFVKASMRKGVELGQEAAGSDLSKTDATAMQLGLIAKERQPSAVGKLIDG